ncbi:hypothetical protein HT031_003414 [Scenedesmus sp. PABB004]|nr:hypothetical protein HT031_003414 [Scenedesmus sp. PABB004]
MEVKLRSRRGGLRKSTTTNYYRARRMALLHREQVLTDLCLQQAFVLLLMQALPGAADDDGEPAMEQQQDQQQAQQPQQQQQEQQQQQQQQQQEQQQEAQQALRLPHPGALLCASGGAEPLSFDGGGGYVAGLLAHATAEQVQRLLRMGPGDWCAAYAALASRLALLARLPADAAAASAADAAVDDFFGLTLLAQVLAADLPLRAATLTDVATGQPAPSPVPAAHWRRVAAALALSPGQAQQLLVAFQQFSRHAAGRRGEHRAAASELAAATRAKELALGCAAAGDAPAPAAETAEGSGAAPAAPAAGGGAGGTRDEAAVSKLRGLLSGMRVSSTMLTSFTLNVLTPQQRQALIVSCFPYIPRSAPLLQAVLMAATPAQEGLDGALTPAQSAAFVLVTGPGAAVGRGRGPQPTRAFDLSRAFEEMARAWALALLLVAAPLAAQAVPLLNSVTLATQQQAGAARRLLGALGRKLLGQQSWVGTDMPSFNAAANNWYQGYPNRFRAGNAQSSMLAAQMGSPDNFGAGMNPYIGGRKLLSQQSWVGTDMPSFNAAANNWYQGYPNRFRAGNAQSSMLAAQMGSPDNFGAGMNPYIGGRKLLSQQSWVGTDMPSFNAAANNWYQGYPNRFRAGNAQSSMLAAQMGSPDNFGAGMNPYIGGRKLAQAQLAPGMWSGFFKDAAPAPTNGKPFIGFGYDVAPGAGPAPQPQMWNGFFKDILGRPSRP